MISEMKQRVLIAEDSRVMAKVMQLNLARAGFEAEVAENGLLAWERLCEEPFDLLLTDFQMPEMEGDELCRLLRQCALNADIPVILVSAKGFEIDIPGLKREVGIADVIYKPFSPRQIVETVKRTLSPTPLPS
ncbi:response regulator [Thalassoglobus polymorphus]|uniref:Transcriptional regulatory protein YycF n=1 Tax=Thalassoglobus polymorphus TaxID=2527994 RepID=A0A517QPT9_9PLAN|nr:response regulator [Thalassoglobus polymorphus]QDT33658.1 Transcriptional regulatory protein YycF [Thalassoglobus polymorphus]